jgi:hypothetical protein
MLPRHGIQDGVVVPKEIADPPGAFDQVNLAVQHGQGNRAFGGRPFQKRTRTVNQIGPIRTLIAQPVIRPIERPSGPPQTGRHEDDKPDANAG